MNMESIPNYSAGVESDEDRFERQRLQRENFRNDLNMLIELEAGQAADLNAPKDKSEIESLKSLMEARYGNAFPALMDYVNSGQSQIVRDRFIKLSGNPTAEEVKNLNWFPPRLEKDKSDK